MRKKTNFLDEEIENFQNSIDLFFQDWVKLWGEKLISNYIHMYQSGHISELLYHWRNLYKYSQQGWEALNTAIKSFFFRRTNRGGFSGTNTQKSKLLGIIKWLQRRMIFICGYTEEDIMKFDISKVSDDLLDNIEDLYN